MTTRRPVRRVALADHGGDARDARDRPRARRRSTTASRTGSSCGPTEGGRVVVVQGDPFTDARRRRSPTGFNVRTMVHEYGGGAYAVHRGTVFFSNFADATALPAAMPGAAPVPITPETDGDAAIRRRHDHARRLGGGSACASVTTSARDRPTSSNELVAIPTDGSAEPRVIAGRPRLLLRRRGSRRTGAVWRGCRGTCRGCRGTGPSCSSRRSSRRRLELGERQRPSPGACGEESIWQPTWSPDGRPRLRERPERLVEPRAGPRRRAAAVLHAAEAEFGYPQWVFGEHSYRLPGRRADRLPLRPRGRARTPRCSIPTTGELVDLDLPHDALRWGPGIRGRGFADRAHRRVRPTGRTRWCGSTSRARSVEVLRRERRASRSTRRTCRSPNAIEFPTDGGLHRARALLPADESRRVGPGGRAAAA